MRYSNYIIIRFKHGFALDGNLIGKSIRFNSRNYEFRLMLPKLDDDGFLKNPLSFHITGFDFGKHEWGNCSRSCTSDGKILELKPTVHAVGLYLTSNELISTSVITDIRHKVEKCLDMIYFIKTGALRAENLSATSLISDFVYASYDEIKQSFIPTFECSISLELSPTPRITLKDLIFIIKNIDKDISIQYELLNNAIKHQFLHQYRDCVLTSATIIEITLKRELIKYLKTQINSTRVIDDLIKEISGFSKIIEKLKKYGVQYDSKICNIIKDATISCRNKIIHSGDNATREQAVAAVKHAREILEFYHVDYFE